MTSTSAILNLSCFTTILPLTHLAKSTTRSGSLVLEPGFSALSFSGKQKFQTTCRFRGDRQLCAKAGKVAVADWVKAQNPLAAWQLWKGLGCGRDANKPAKVDRGQWTQDLCQSCPAKRQKMMYQTGQGTEKRQERRGGRRRGQALTSSSFLYLKLHLQKRQLCIGVLLLIASSSFSCHVSSWVASLGLGQGRSCLSFGSCSCSFSCHYCLFLFISLLFVVAHVKALLLCRVIWCFCGFLFVFCISFWLCPDEFRARCFLCLYMKWIRNLMLLIFQSLSLPEPFIRVRILACNKRTCC